MNILLVSATTFEIAPLLQYLDKHAEKLSFFDYKLGEHVIYPLVTGVGALNTSFAMARYQDMSKTDVALNIGLAGSFNPDYEIGNVVEVVADRFGDLGVEENDGNFTDVYELGLTERNQYPFEDGWINAMKPKYKLDLPQVTGITVNKVHGHQKSIELIRSKYKPDVESMEGAGFAYACKIMDVAGHQIRCISNNVEPRNKDNWQIAKAIDNLNEALIKIINVNQQPQ